MPQQQVNVTTTATSARAYGAIYWSAGAAAANEANTPIKVAGTTAALGTANKVTQATTNRLTYTGVNTRTFKCNATFSVDCSAATSLKMHLYKGGAAITGATIQRTVGGTDIGAMAIHASVDLATNEYVELWCETNDGDNVNVPCGQLSIESVD